MRCKTRVRICVSPNRWRHQFAQLANRRWRDVNAHDTLAAQGIGQAAGIQPIRLGRIAGLQLRLPCVDHAHAAHATHNLIDEIHVGLVASTATAICGVHRSEECGDPLGRPRKTSLPTIAHQFSPSRRPEKTPCANRSRYTDQSPWAVLLSRPGADRVCPRSCYSGDRVGDGPFI